MTSLAAQIPFPVLCTVFEDITTGKTPTKKFQVLSTFLEKCRSESDSLGIPSSSLFPILRLFLLKLDRERGPNGLKQTSLANLYIKVFCLGKTSTEAKSLLNYKEPLKSRDTTNDFAERVSVILKTRLKKSSSFTVEDVNTFLDTISSNFGENRKQDGDFIKMASQCSALELKWLTRIILKDLRLSIGSKKILDAFHPDAGKLFGQKSNLKVVCETLVNPKKRLDRKVSNINVFSPFKPMLLERLPLTGIRKFFVDGKHGDFIIQTKFDGERSLLHVKDGKFKYFTRHGLDITQNAAYGETKESRGFLTKKIASLLNPNCRSIILDGEMMGYHKDKKIFSTKGVAFDVKKLTFNSKHQPCLIAYDILLYNDELLINQPLEQRLRVLENAFEECPGVLEKATNEKVSSMEEIIASFNQSIDNHEEGIVLKKIDSLYHVDTREGSGCYKIKTEYSSEFIKDVDLVIVGGFYGDGKHSGLFNSFLTAGVNATVPKTFFSVVSVSSGLTDENIRRLNKRFAPFWTKTKPDSITGPRRGGPDVWIEPKDSVVLEVRATEMLRCNSQPGGWTLRFPRVEKIREDKPFDECCSLNELRSLKTRKGVVQKLTKRHATAEDIWEIPVKTRKERHVMPVIKVDDCYLGTHAPDVAKVSRLFQGKEFCVMSGLKPSKIGGQDAMTKPQIETLLISHSGTIVQNPRKETFCVIAGDSSGIKVKNVVDSKNYDVIEISWIFRATRQENLGRIVEWLPWEIIGMTKQTMERLREQFDDYYDDYFNETDEEGLNRSIERVSMLKAHEEVVLAPNVEELEKQMFAGKSAYGIFRGLVGFFTDEADVRIFQFRFGGGEVRREVDERVTDVFVGEGGVRMIELYGRINERGRPDVKIVRSKWIDSCCRDGRILDRSGYVIT